MTATGNGPRRSALVVVNTMIPRDPRVRRQVEWLAGDDWTVDTVGLGEERPERVRDHFPLGPETAPTGLAALPFWLLQSNERKFEQLAGGRIPAAARTAVAGGAYDLVVFNDHHFIPWVANGAIPASTRVHLDMHEYVPARALRDTAYRRLSAPHRDWVRTFIGHPRFTTRTTVARAIAELYAREFGIVPPAIVRNSPPFVDQSPRAVDAARIRLIHHGVGNPHRGLHEMIDAMREVGDRFELTLMLVGAGSVIDELRERAAGLEDRIRFRDPVPLAELPAVVNEYDLEVMFYPPRNRNLEFALPNKFFEAVQGRIGVVIGESPMMVELVERFGIGVVVHGWLSADLARALDGITAEEVDRLKRATDVAARELHADVERAAFLAAVANGGAT